MVRRVARIHDAVFGSAHPYDSRRLSLRKCRSYRYQLRSAAAIETARRDTIYATRLTGSEEILKKPTARIP